MFLIVCDQNSAAGFVPIDPACLDFPSEAPNSVRGGLPTCLPEPSNPRNSGEDRMSGRMRPWLCMVAGAALAGCVSPSVESAQVGSGGAIETAIKRYYSSNASEDRGHCPRPYIDGITGVEVIEDTPERLVAEVRYFFRDRIRDQPGDEDDGSVRCIGFSKRTFTVDRTEQGPKVVDMSGPQEERYTRTLF